MEAIIVPVAFFVTLAVIVVAALFINYKNKSQIQQTLQLSIEKGQDLSPDLVKQLLRDKPFNDLKKGITLISIGLALAVFSLFDISEQDFELVGIGLIPVIIGLGYIVIWKLRPKFDDQ
ncbi:DUF6249 domain-containing protein [Catenovulum sp. 2E275]|uniref:DUF6249 domain-containing protein n=1 Tax=Catenovulum sp. 2E275 TaxID=2980497 RepID=UPI0021CFFD71|nr:DUF6249 domain-containing protein [Catenovulum sp. 2E275]MCU4675889.1 DUF6249 domain-containing protein [Catenovulum sp. 2E275]